jgi:hypothetical protein
LADNQILKFRISINQNTEIPCFPYFPYFGVVSAPPNPQEMQFVKNTEIPYFDFIVMIRGLFEIIAHTFAMVWQHGRSRGSKRRVCWAGPGDVSPFMMD